MKLICAIILQSSTWNARPYAHFKQCFLFFKRYVNIENNFIFVQKLMNKYIINLLLKKCRACSISKIPSHHFRSRNGFVWLQLSTATHFLLSFLTINLNELRLLFLQNIVFSYQKVIHIIATCFIFADFILAVLYYEVRKKNIWMRQHCKHNPILLSNIH